MSFSGDPVNEAIASAAKGTAAAVIEWTEEKIKQYAKKFKDKNLAFIEDTETIKLAKELRNSGEFNFFKRYIKDDNLHVLFQMGLTIKSLEKNGKDWKSLVKKIHKNYDREGVHIANFVANGLFSKYVNCFLDKGIDEDELKEEIEYLFKNIDNIVSFIQQDDNPKQKVGEIVTKIQAFSPLVFIISSIGVAITVCEKVKKLVMQKVSSTYDCESYDSPQKGRRIYFLIRKDTSIF